MYICQGQACLKNYSCDMADKNLPQKDGASGTRGSMAYWHVEFCSWWFWTNPWRAVDSWIFPKLWSDNTHIRQLWFTVTVIINRRWCSCGNRLNKRINVWHFRKFSNIKLTVLTSSPGVEYQHKIQAASLIIINPEEERFCDFAGKDVFLFSSFSVSEIFLPVTSYTTFF